MPIQLDARLRHLQPGLDAIPPVERQVEDGRLRETRRFRGLTLDRAFGYLENLGGERRGEDRVVADGWEAVLSSRRVPVGPSFRLTEVEVTWTGERAVLVPVILRFRLKAFRAPG